MKSNFKLALLASAALLAAQGVQSQTASSTPSSSAASAGKPPKIVCFHPNFDFHDQEEGPDITHLFTIRNVGKGTLIINNVGTSCGCTAAVVDNKEIPPGGKGKIKVTYHTSGRPGHAEKTITVSSNDPVNGNFQLKIQMTVVREIDTMPDRLYLFNIKKGEARSSMVTILGRPGNNLEVTSAESTNKIVTVALTPYAQPTPGSERQGGVLKVDLPATLAIGNFTDDIQVKTNDPKKPQIDVQVMGEIVGRIQLNNKNLFFGPHQESPSTVNITVDHPQGFAIRKVESFKHLAKPSIKKNVLPDGSDQYILSVTVVKNLPKDSDGKDQVFIYTNDPEQPKLTVDVTINH